jgi:hypothetical protein
MLSNRLNPIQSAARSGWTRSSLRFEVPISNGGIYLSLPSAPSFVGKRWPSHKPQLPHSPIQRLNFTSLPRSHTPSLPPFSSQGVRFRHWLTSKLSKRSHPSTTASTPTPVTLTQPRTLRARNSRRCRPITRSDESETADPQKARLRCCSEGHPRARTSVAMSLRAQQNDCTNPLAKLTKHEE